jgi:photosystem II stability/assembly factor-like uncharacterized protein
MSTFAVTNTGQILDSVNYLLSNFGQSGNVGNLTIPTGTLIGNTTTGIVTPFGTGGNAYSYLYQWVNLRYANNATGSSGFSTVPTNSDYFGVYNSPSQTASLNATDYSWYEVAGGFGTTKTIYYSAIGGRQVLFAAASSLPNPNYVVSVANVAIDLDVVTTAAGTPGERGPVPLAYVITTADPTLASSSTLSGWFSSSRTANTPPIGTGLTPVVSGDTAYFVYPTTGSSETYSFNGSAWISAEGQVVSGATIVANTTPGNAIIVSTITGNLIAANTITGNLIAANTITATQISSDYVYAGNIISLSANIGNNSSSGYWLQNQTGNARFGGNVSIGANLTVQGLITTGSLDANTVNTGQLQNKSATTVLFQGAPGTAVTYPVAYYNTVGNTTWPYDTRGFAVPAVAIRPTTEGSTNGSSILITLTAGVQCDSDNNYNLTELWRTGATVSYANVFNSVTLAVANNSSVTNNEEMAIVGNDGVVAFSSDGGDTWGFNTSLTADWIDSSSIQVNNSGGFAQDKLTQGGLVTSVTSVGGPSGSWFTPDGTRLSSSRVLFTGLEVGNVNINNDIGIITGQTAFSMMFRPFNFSSPGPATQTQLTAPTGVFSDIYDMDWGYATTGNTTVKNAVFACTGGEVLTTQFQYHTSNSQVTYSAMQLRNAPTDSNLFGVSCDQGTNAPTAWIAVGEAGVIMRSTDSGATWTSISSPTTENLRSVIGYGGEATKRFVAVGDDQTIIMSSDGGLTWTVATVPTPTDSRIRNLNSVSFCPTSGTSGAGLWTAVGEGVIYKCNKTSTTWSIYYQDAAVVSGSIQRLVYIGSNPDVNNNTIVSNAQIIGNTVVSYTYQDTNYDDNNTYQYYLVIGNMNSAANMNVRFPSLTVQEIKR